VVSQDIDAPAAASAGELLPVAQPLHVQALALAFLAGLALSFQAYVNGHLATSVGSPRLAGFISVLVGFCLMLLVVTTTGALRRAAVPIRAGARPRWWHLVMCANSAFVITVMAAAAPKVGVALLTVAVVCGQIGGGVIVDGFGLSPAGRRPLTVARGLAIVVAVGAVVIGTLGKKHGLHLGLLVLAVLAGVTIGLHQGALGHLARLTGEPFVAAATTFTIGSVVSLVVWLAIDGPTAPLGWSAPPIDWLGGLAGAVVVVSMARVVATLGVLRLALVVVAGQSVGALVLDLVSPAIDESVTAATVVSAALTLAAVAVSGMTIGRARSVA
jgi:bacterial/archaeal transporter family-2 protein